MIARFDPAKPVPRADVCIIGSGPAGLALAFGLADQGRSVLILESGQQTDHGKTSALSRGHIEDPARHAPLEVAARRGLGGTSAWWGGRCVPFDEVDLDQRDHVPLARWPLRLAELKQASAEAAAFLGIGEDRFTASPAEALSPDVRFDTLERWSRAPRVGRTKRRSLEQASLITCLLDATAIDIEDRSDGATTVLARNSLGEATVSAAVVVIACGGLETTRLMLNVQTRRPHLFGGPTGVLGRCYAGHLSGKIADLVLSDPDEARLHNFFLDGGAWARRRFTLTADRQRESRLLNAAFWIDNPPFYDTAHRNGLLSLVWLALRMPGLGSRLLAEGVRRSHLGPGPHDVAAHLWNVLARAPSTLSGVLAVLWGRYVQRPYKPGFLLLSRSGRYPLHFHAEQAPSPDSTVRLDDQTDALGLRRLRVDLRFSKADAESVLRSHEILDRALQAKGWGRLAYHDAPETRLERILAQASDGFHQTGTVRMGTDPATSIVDPNGRVHGTRGLFVASSATFPSSGQANPTFMVVTLARRLANHLKSFPFPQTVAGDA